MGAGFRMDISGLLNGLNEMDKRRLFGMEVMARGEAKRMEARAKQDRPWTDRTGAARRGIKGSAERFGARITIRLSGGVNYQVYLELKKFKHKGSMAVLFPTMDKMRAEVIYNIVRIKG